MVETFFGGKIFNKKKILNKNLFKQIVSEAQTILFLEICFRDPIKILTVTNFHYFLHSKNLTLIKKRIFPVKHLYSLPGASFFLNISASAQTSSAIFKGSLNVLLDLTFLLLSYLNFLAASFFYFLQLKNFVVLSKLLTCYAFIPHFFRNKAIYCSFCDV